MQRVLPLHFFSSAYTVLLCKRCSKMCTIKRMQKICKFHVVWLVFQLFCLFVPMKLCQFYWASITLPHERTKRKKNKTTTPPPPLCKLIIVACLIVCVKRGTRRKKNHTAMSNFFRKICNECMCTLTRIYICFCEIDLKKISLNIVKSLTFQLTQPITKLIT